MSKDSNNLQRENRYQGVHFMHSVATGKCLRHQTKGCFTCGNFPLRLPPPGTNHLPPYLQRLQVSILRVAQQGGDAVVVPHAADVGVAPHGEDLSDDGHATQGAVHQLHYLRIAHLLRKQRDRGRRAH